MIYVVVRSLGRYVHNMYYNWLFTLLNDNCNEVFKQHSSNFKLKKQQNPKLPASYKGALHSEELVHLQ